MSQWAFGRIVVNHYAGAYLSPILKAKAESGLYYARCTGQGHTKIEGEGPTVEHALEDLINRLTEHANGILSLRNQVESIL